VKLVKGIIESVESRINAPYFGYLFCSFLAINWEALFYLFLAKKEDQYDNLVKILEQFHDTVLKKDDILECNFKTFLPKKIPDYRNQLKALLRK
jgi:hypothetical protein